MFTLYTTWKQNLMKWIKPIAPLLSTHKISHVSHSMHLLWFSICSLTFILCQSFMLFFSSSSIIAVSLTLLFLFSLLLWTAFPMCCRRGYTQSQEGIAEKTSLVSTVSVAMLLTKFYNWSVWSHEWKMTILLLWPKKQVGESYPLATSTVSSGLRLSCFTAWSDNQSNGWTHPFIHSVSVICLFPQNLVFIANVSSFIMNIDNVPLKNMR